MDHQNTFTITDTDGWKFTYCDTCGVAWPCPDAKLWEAVQILRERVTQLETLVEELRCKTGPRTLQSPTASSERNN